ncbi:MAG: hypothetical protein KKF56_00725 [Nanoarchaeota archaeon]|nr:hypothetical protein [Nanoarchaeota archaeon]
MNVRDLGLRWLNPDRLFDEISRTMPGSQVVCYGAFRPTKLTLPIRKLWRDFKFGQLVDVRVKAPVFYSSNEEIYRVGSLLVVSGVYREDVDYEDACPRTFEEMRFKLGMNVPVEEEGRMIIGSTTVKASSKSGELKGYFSRRVSREDEGLPYKNRLPMKEWFFREGLGPQEVDVEELFASPERTEESQVNGEEVG